MPLVHSIVTNDVMRYMIGIADAIGDGSPPLGFDLTNVIDVLS